MNKNMAPKLPNLPCVAAFWALFCPDVCSYFASYVGGVSHSRISDFLRSQANGSLISSSFTGFFPQQEGSIVHSHIQLASTDERFTHSLYSREYIHSIHANGGH